MKLDIDSGERAVVISLGILGMLSLSSAFPHHCRDDQYWFPITGRCEPCSRICDPPGRHENDCPHYCENYTTASTSASTTLPSTSILPSPKYSPVAGVEQNGSEHITLPVILGIAIGVVAGIILNFALGCVIYKKRDSLKSKWPFRQILKKAGYKTTTDAVQPDPDTDQERPDEAHELLEDDKDSPTQSVLEVDLR